MIVNEGTLVHDIIVRAQNEIFNLTHTRVRLVPVDDNEALLISIRDTVCSTLHVTEFNIVSASRIREITEARQLAMFFMRIYAHNRVSLKWIGMKFGGRHHATVLNAIHVTLALKDSDRDFKIKYNLILKTLTAMYGPTPIQPEDILNHD